MSFKANKKDEFDTEYTKDIVCPHCGAEDGDSWESNDCDGNTQQCGSCDNDFVLAVHHEVTYSTSKVNCEEQKPAKLHQWGEKIDILVTTEADIERYVREGSCLARENDGEPRRPHQTYVRTCAACGDNGYSEDVDIGGVCVWKGE